MTISLPIGRRTTKCLVPGASAIWLFNEGSGTTLTDYSGNGIDGTLGAAGAAPTWGVTGLTFDGGDYVTIGTAAGVEVGSQDHTLIAVVTPTANGDSGILGKNKFGANEWGLHLASTQKFGFRSRDGALSVTSSAPDTCTLGKTYMVTGVRSGATIALYLGATLVDTDANAADKAPATSGDNFMIGACVHTGTRFTGTVHAAAVYPFGFSPAQIAQERTALAAILAPRGVTGL